MGVSLQPAPRFTAGTSPTTRICDAGKVVTSVVYDSRLVGTKVSGGNISSPQNAKNGAGSGGRGATTRFGGLSEDRHGPGQELLLSPMSKKVSSQFLRV